MAPQMTKAVTFHLPPDLYEELQDEARRQGRPVGELVREAVMIRYDTVAAAIHMSLMGIGVPARRRAA